MKHIQFRPDLRCHTKYQSLVEGFIEETYDIFYCYWPENIIYEMAGKRFIGLNEIH